MRDESQKYKLYTRRSFVLAGINLALLTLVGGNYFYLQIIQGNKYKDLSQKNHIKLQIIPAPRGKLLDFQGNPLADDNFIYSLGIDPLKVRQLKVIIPKLEQALGRPLKIGDKEIEKRLLKRTRTMPLILEDDLNWQDLAKISEKLGDIEGADSLRRAVRYYPLGEKAAHLTGYISAASEIEIEKYKIQSFSDVKIGKTGLEKEFDQLLRGEIGYKKVEVDVKGKLVKELAYESYKGGCQLNLSINRDLQEFVHDLMVARGVAGAVVVMRAKTGQIMALHSMPTFDPNVFSIGVSKDEWRALTNNDQNPLINNAISTPVPPGSTFKPLTALAALRAGVDPERKVFCSGHFQLGGHDFKCWKTEGHGPLNMQLAIAQSCNPYFYSTSINIGMDIITNTGEMLGYGHKTNIELPFENIGIMAGAAWKKARFGAAWTKGDTVNCSIGQGYMLVTPIQLATMTARLATNKLIKPTLLLNNIGNIEPLNFDPGHLHIIQEAMMVVMNDPRGLLYGQNFAESGLKVCGKTGTSQVAALKYKNKSHDFKHHALFTSFAPYDDPEYVVVAFVEHGEAGARAAAPIAKQIYLKLMGKKTQLDNNI